MQQDDTFIRTPKHLYLNINEIYPISDEINGGVDNFRWNTSGSLKEMRAYANAQKLHKESIARLGLLLPFPVIKLPSDYSTYLDGKAHTYKKGDYVTIDFNGRLRSVKEMIADGYKFDTPDGKVLCADCTHMVIGNRKKVTDEVLEDMHTCVVALSTGYTKWDIYMHILSTANSITDKTQSRIWNYLKDKLIDLSTKNKSDSDKLTPNNVCYMILGRIPTEKQLLRKKLDFDLAFKRYTNSILDKILDLRESMTAANLPSSFLDKFGAYLVKSAKGGYCEGKKWELDKNTGEMEIITSTIKKYFESEHDLYSDEHFAEFETIIDFWVKALEFHCPAPGRFQTGGWPAPAGEAGQAIHTLASLVFQTNELRWEMMTGDDINE
jgi:hypothetical protein